jgi:hypothetical protein
LADVGYRVLSVLVQARYQLALLVAVLNAIFLLLEVRMVLDEPSWLGAVGLLDSPLLLVVAVALLAQLPPGVVFRGGAPGRVPPGPLPSACRATGSFQVGNRWLWRLLVPSSLGLVEWGGIQVLAPSYAVRPRRRLTPPLGVGTLELSGPLRGRQPLWAADPMHLQRLLRAQRPPHAPAEMPGRLAISPRQIQEVAAGWQYAALRRYPALRIRYLGDDRAAQVTYLAFDTPAERDAVRARLR